MLLYFQILITSHRTMKSKVFVSVHGCVTVKQINVTWKRLSLLVMTYKNNIFSGTVVASVYYDTYFVT